MNHPAYAEFISMLMTEFAFCEGCKLANVEPTRRQARKFAQKRGASYRAWQEDTERIARKFAQKRGEGVPNEQK